MVSVMCCSLSKHREFPSRCGSAPELLVKVCFLSPHWVLCASVTSPNWTGSAHLCYLSLKTQAEPCFVQTSSRKPTRLPRSQWADQTDGHLIPREVLPRVKLGKTLDRRWDHSLQCLWLVSWTVCAVYTCSTISWEPRLKHQFLPCFERIARPLITCLQSAWEQFLSVLQENLPSNIETEFQTQHLGGLRYIGENRQVLYYYGGVLPFSWNIRFIIL